MITIKLADHITVKQITRWTNMGVNFEIKLYGTFAITNNFGLSKIINEANKI